MSETVDRTPVGVRIGEITLYTASPIEPSEEPCSVAGGELRTELGRLRDRACRRKPDREPIDAYVRRRRDAIVARIDEAARSVCAYARAYPDPVVVVGESLHVADLRRWLLGPGPRCGRAWLLPTAHERLRTIASDRGVPTATVPIAYAAQECHACGVLGDRETDRSVVRCSNPDCEVDRVPVPTNAALVLAQRYRAGKRCRYRSDTSHANHPPTDGGA